MKPRRLQSATIFSIVTTSLVSVATAGTVASPRAAKFPQSRSFPWRRAENRFTLVAKNTGVCHQVAGVGCRKHSRRGKDMVNIALRATSHVAAWIVWHATGVSLLDDLESPRPPASDDHS